MLFLAQGSGELSARLQWPAIVKDMAQRRQALPKILSIHIHRVEIDR